MSDSASRLAHLLRSRLKIKQLAALCAFSEHGSLHRAATAQGMSQPAMSKVLKEIEDTIGAALFERNHSGLHTTPLGERVIFRARSILADLDQLAVELDVMKEGDRASLRIGIIPLLSFSLVANVIEKLSHKNGNYNFSIAVGSTDHLVSSLRSHNLDCVLARLPGKTETEDLDLRVLYLQKSCLVTSSKSVLKRHKGQLKLAELEGFQWVLPQQSTPTRKAVERIFLIAGRTPPTPVIECFDPRIIRLLLEGQPNLLAILPQEIARELAADGELIFFPIETEFSFPEICFIKLKRAHEDPALKKFTKAMELAISEMGKL